VDGKHISIYWLRIHINFFGFALLLDGNLQSCDCIEVRELLGLWGSGHTSHVTRLVIKARSYLQVLSPIYDKRDELNTNVWWHVLMWMNEVYIHMQQSSFAF
jgi:hypothetical protein